MRGLNSISRRGLLGGGASVALLTACGRTETPAAPAAAAKPVGIQLYTLRSEMERDFVATLQRVAQIGYDEVEFAGYFNRPAAEVKQILADVGLKAPSTHVSRDLIRDNPMPSIEAGAEIGHEYLVLNWLAEDERRTLDQYRAWADTCNRFAEQARTAGMKFSYHNHDFEFVAIDGIVPYDILLERCDPALVSFELDLFWTVKAGRDPIEIIRANPTRFPMCHVKDMDEAGNMADVGAGVMDFASIFAAHNFEHYFVERDDTTNPFATAEASYAATARLLGVTAPA